jgi:hypothetical protein
LRATWPSRRRPAPLLMRSCSPRWGSSATTWPSSAASPSVLTQLQPTEPTRAFPSFTVPGGRSLGPLGNRLSHLAAEQALWQFLRPAVNRWRRETLDLAPLPLAGPYPRLRRQRHPTLYAYSPTVLPRPPDWPDHVQVTGYWFLDPVPGWRPPPALAAFPSGRSPAGLRRLWQHGQRRPGRHSAARARGPAPRRGPRGAARRSRRRPLRRLGPCRRRHSACLAAAAHGRGRPPRWRRHHWRGAARRRAQRGLPLVGRSAVVGRAGARTGRRPATGARPAPHRHGAGRRHRPSCRRRRHACAGRRHRLPDPGRVRREVRRRSNRTLAGCLEHSMKAEG